jgi:hypothetical protein
MPARPLLIALLAAAMLPAAAAPVDGDTDPGADPYELAMRWTLAGLSAPPLPGASPLAATDAPTQRFSALPHGRSADSAVPEPGAYALMGLLLLGAGLAARHFTGGRRGLSKKA